MLLREDRRTTPQATQPRRPAPRKIRAAGTRDAARSAPPRVRKFFPETLLWRPELITDDRGEAQLDIELADSITTWRLSASAVSGAGQLGAGEFPLRVFQPFFVDLNLPVALTRNDEVGVPVVVYNYLDKPQTVDLELKPATGSSGSTRLTRPAAESQQASAVCRHALETGTETSARSVR